MDTNYTLKSVPIEQIPEKTGDAHFPNDFMNLEGRSVFLRDYRSLIDGMDKDIFQLEKIISANDNKISELAERVKMLEEENTRITSSMANVTEEKTFN